MTDLRRHIDAYLRARAGVVQPSTLRSERHVLRAWAQHMGGRRLAQIGQADLEVWLADIADRAPTTRRTRLSIVRCLFDWHVAIGTIPRSPARSLAVRVPRRRHRALNADQAAALLRACRDSRDRLIILLGLHLGLRRAEIAGLRLEDIDWRGRSILVTGKGGHERELTIPAELASALDAYLAEHPAIHGPLIRGDRHPHRPVPPVWVGRAVTRIATDAGVKRLPWDGISAHALRHTAATDVARATNGNVVVVRDLLGHAQLSTAQTYVAGDVEGLRGAIEGRTYDVAA